MHKVTFLVVLLLSVTIVNCQPSTNQQYFRVRPQQSVEVIEGSTVVLGCEVGNQAGQVQWGKNAFVLGYDRSIPGYPRYSMDGNPREGVHNLRIESARREDEGEYQCQVGPGPASQPNDPIRANSKLTVLLRPTSIDIVGHSNGSKVEIRSEENLKLECVVSGGKPAASIKWYRKNYELRSVDHGEVLNTVAEVPASAGADVDTSPADITITKSSINLRPIIDDNGVPYTCEAHHPALEAPLRHTVTLSVQYPPGPPEVSGYVDGQVVKAGDTLTLTCRARGGNPLAQLVWFKNNEQVDFSYATTNGNESVSSYTFVVDRSDNKALYRCESSWCMNKAPGDSVASIAILNILYPSEPPYIVGYAEGTPIRSGSTQRLSCVAHGGNPLPELKWFSGDDEITTGITPSIEGQSVSSELVLTTQDSDHGAQYRCEASSSATDKPQTASTTLTVHYKPKLDRSPVLFRSVDSGASGRLLCRAQSSPKPTFVWRRDDTIIATRRSEANIDGHEEKYLIEEIFQVDSITYESVLIIQRVTRSDYGEYKCVARNDLGMDSISVNFSQPIRPDTPLALQIINVTATTVTLRWTPGFDGGLAQSFQIRFKQSGQSSFFYVDVFPGNATEYTVGSLAPDSEYVFAVMAYNELGQSEFSADQVKATTEKAPLPSETERVFSQVLSGKVGEIPRLIIICVSAIGSLLLLNLILVVYFVRKRRRKWLEENSDTTSKDGNIEMISSESSGSASLSYNNYYHNVVAETSAAIDDDCYHQSKFVEQKFVELYI